MKTNRKEINYVFYLDRAIGLAVIANMTAGCAAEKFAVEQLGIDRGYVCGGEIIGGAIIIITVFKVFRGMFRGVNKFFNDEPNNQSSNTGRRQAYGTINFENDNDDSGDRGRGGEGLKYGRGNEPGSGVNQTPGPERGKTDSTYNARPAGRYSGQGAGDVPHQSSGQKWNGDMGETTALQVLHVPRGASGEEIKQAHRDVARNSHPDKGGSTEDMQKANRAREVLDGKK